MIVVLGAGLAGLSTAYHLTGSSCRVIEKEPGVGGLARSVSEGGFVFDFTGHLLHFRSDYVRNLCQELLGENQSHFERSAWVHFQNQLVPYPFQVNTAQLPTDVRMECVTGFAESLLPSNTLDPGGFDEPGESERLPLSFLNNPTPTGGFACSFDEWVNATFGHGFAKHFFLPFNSKNFCADTSTLSAEWVSWAIPKPDLEDVLRGALGINRKEFGYNPQFTYPKMGGIQKLPDALAAKVGGIETGRSVVKIRCRDKVCEFDDGTSESYDALVATNPLPELIEMLDEVEPAVKEAVSSLRWSAVTSFNFGLDVPLDHGHHWVYFPEPSFPFYRVGFPSNLSSTMTPDGCGSVCAEVAWSPKDGPPDKDCEATVLQGLQSSGMITDPKNITVRRRLDLPYAYVLFDDRRRAALPLIFRALLERDIIPVGRYGSWNYLSMESTILQGKETAEYLAGTH